MEYYRLRLKRVLTFLTCSALHPREFFFLLNCAKFAAKYLRERRSPIRPKSDLKMNFFSKAKAIATGTSSPTEKKNSTAAVIEKLNEARDRMSKKEAFLMSKINVELKTAKLNSTKNRTVALAALKRKRIYEKELERTINIKSNLEGQIDILGNARETFEMAAIMKQGATALKKEQQAVKIDEVEKTFDEIEEAMGEAMEAREAIARPINMGPVADMDDLEAELAQLDEQELQGVVGEASEPSQAEEILQRAPKAPQSKLPTVAQPPRPTKQVDEDDELAELQRSMAL